MVWCWARKMAFKRSKVWPFAFSYVTFQFYRIIVTWSLSHCEGVYTLRVRLRATGKCRYDFAALHRFVFLQQVNQGKLYQADKLLSSGHRINTSKTYWVIYCLVIYPIYSAFNPVSYLTIRLNNSPWWQRSRTEKAIMKSANATVQEIFIWE